MVAIFNIDFHLQRTIDLLNQGLTAAMLGSTNLGPSYFNCNFFDIYPIVTKLCNPFLEDNRNNYGKFSRVLISTSGFIRHLILCPELLHVFRSVTHTALRLKGCSGFSLNVAAWCKYCSHDTIRNIVTIIT